MYCIAGRHRFAPACVSIIIKPCTMQRMRTSDASEEVPAKILCTTTFLNTHEYGTCTVDEQ